MLKVDYLADNLVVDSADNLVDLVVDRKVDLEDKDKVVALVDNNLVLAGHRLVGRKVEGDLEVVVLAAAKEDLLEEEVVSVVQAEDHKEEASVAKVVGHKEDFFKAFYLTI